MGASPTKSTRHLRRNLTEGRGGVDIGLGDARVALDEGREGLEGVHGGGETVEDGRTLEADQSNLDDLIGVGVEARRLQVQGHPWLLEQGRAQPRERRGVCDRASRFLPAQERRSFAHGGVLGVAGAPPSCMEVGDGRRDRQGIFI